ncbi:AraC family transcriptional regulator [Dysosmobacter sp.]|uniref:AraC family transcriptional regulator n=1 Tax=Dysosmobacter sp. TaxID=2591382 RepID=UPI002A843829|nr:AraC family transcriptional regulator [Dysosmobacter sp.]MDY3281386.1 AraC family transcriptional regulator [Dysosmobacter sp.]
MDLHYAIYHNCWTTDVRPHFHEYYEIMIPLNNNATFYVHERSYPARYGQACFFSSQDIHRFTCNQDNTYECHTIYLPRDTLKDISTKRTNFIDAIENAPLVTQLSPPDLTAVLNYLRVLEQEPSSEMGNDFSRDIIFQQFMLSMLSVAQHSNIAPHVSDDQPSVVDNILSYIAQNYQNNISLETISRQFYLSKSRLSQIFKNATGISIGNYIIAYRIQKACCMLKKGLSEREIYSKVGFNEYTHFIRTFRKKTGMSPSEYAKYSSEHYVYI